MHNAHLNSYRRPGKTALVTAVLAAALNAALDPVPTSGQLKRIVQRYMPGPRSPRPVHQRQPQARERARRMGGDAWAVFKAADRARRGLPMGA